MVVDVVVVIVSVFVVVVAVVAVRVAVVLGLVVLVVRAAVVRGVIARQPPNQHRVLGITNIKNAIWTRLEMLTCENETL